MDSMELERERGITIQSAATYCQWGDYHINVIDTPGHVDFTIEVERALRVLDGGILVLCGVAGVQSQSLTVDRQMRRYDIPRLAFINKLDRMGADPWKVIQMVRDKMQLNAAAVQIPIGLGEAHQGVIDIIRRKKITFEGTKGEQVVTSDDIPSTMIDLIDKKRLELINTVCDADEELAEQYLENDDVTAQELEEAIQRSTRARTFVPVLMGSAYKNKGVQPLLDAVIDYLPSPVERQGVVAIKADSAALSAAHQQTVPITCSSEEPLLALAFKLEESRFGQLTYVRIYRGTLKRGNFIVNARTRKSTKVPRLVRMHSNEMEDIDTAYAGDVVALFGIECASMDTFEAADNVQRLALSSMFVPRPVISLAVSTKKGSSSSASDNFSKALQRFTREDPTLRVHTDPESKQIILSGMGELHLEVYIERLRREYNVDTDVGNPKVNYRETISEARPFDYLHKKQTGGAGQYARVIGRIEPISEEELEAAAAEAANDENSEQSHTANIKTFQFVNELIGANIPPEFIPSCEKGAQEAVSKGCLVGAPIENIRVVLTDGVTHPVDSSDLAFRAAMIGAIRGALNTARPAVLEPISKLEVIVPSEFQGDVLGTINQRRGVITHSEISDDGSIVTLVADVPLAAMFSYSSTLRSLTQGKGEFTMEYKSHERVTPDTQAELMKAYQARLAEEQAQKK
uniref:Elongation factor G, mitochondrial n=1 Tax=Aureoumbra lagunensis TaxID=44058 RepID=A0A7S3NDP0_9STRA